MSPSHQKSIRLTMAQALVRAMAAQMTLIGDKPVPLFGGVWAIFGHGNVAGLGEALYGLRDVLPTYRGHNEQTMAHAAIAFAKANFRRRVMAVTTSIGPGATNVVTAAAVAHVNRLPLLILPGDVFAHRRPDPVLQQVEDFGDGTITANDCFRPVSRYFDRITRPEQIMPVFERALAVLTDPAACGPVTVALCQDVQAEAYDYPVRYFEPRIWTPRRPRPSLDEIEAAVAELRGASQPLIIAGGGVLYSDAAGDLARFAEAHGIPVAETQAGKSSLPHDHPLNLGAIGVTGTSAANAIAADADVVLAVGTRLQDFTTGSWALFQNPRVKMISLNVQPFDATKHHALPLVADAKAGLADLAAALVGWRVPAQCTERIARVKAEWNVAAAAVTAKPSSANALPSDAQVIGAVQRACPDAVIVGAAGGLPGELHKLWQATTPGSYHLEYGYSCMGYEIAGGLGVKMARPDAEVVVMVGDGSYLMANSEIATSILLGKKLTIVVLDNGGFGCIDRLQRASGGAGFNNLFADASHSEIPVIDLVAHAASLGANALRCGTVEDLEREITEMRMSTKTTVFVIATDPRVSTAAGGHWWDVAIPEVSDLPDVATARRTYDDARARQR